MSADSGQDSESPDLATVVRLLTGAAMFELRSDESLGLGPMKFSDGPTGVRGSEFVGGHQVALLPNATLLASTWHTPTIERAAGLLGAQAQVQGVHVVLGPTVNLHRTPLGGRLFEAFSEDPLLTGVMAAAYVRGIQSRGVGACLKHFVANETETERTSVDSRVDERTLHETYLLPFEIAVTDAGPWTVMAAYNAVNGVSATAHDVLLNDVLKRRWGFDGVVMSDWFAATDAIGCANGGLDLVMPGPGGPWDDELLDAVRAGLVPESVVREHLRRLLLLAERAGVRGSAGQPNAGDGLRSASGPTDPDTRAELRYLATAGMTVLTGDRIPCAVPDTGELLLVGRHALHTVGQGGGSAEVRPPHVVSVADGLRAVLGERLRVLDGVEVRSSPEPADPSVVADPDTGAEGMRVTSYREDGDEHASTYQPVSKLPVDLDGGPHDGAACVVMSADLVAGEPSEFEVGVIGAGRWSIAIDGTHHDVELTVDNPGRAVFDPPHWVTRVPVGPGSRVTATRTRSGGFGGLVGLVARPLPKPDDDALAAAASAAGHAELAVVVVGLTTEQETENQDKATLALPGRQDELVETVASRAASTVVVVNAATPVLMPWIDRVDAVLWAGLPGQEAGHAVADVLLGVREATGRLVTTFPAHDGDGPAWSPSPVEGVMRYSEGRAVGYRGWSGAEPRFWFGHGLGWTTWEYLEAETDGPQAVKVLVRNTGCRTGREVVQVYLDPDGDPEAGPVRLAGWAVVDAVPPGETRTVRVELDPRVLRTWTSSGWRALHGGRMLVARGLGDVRLRLSRGRA